MENKKTYYLDFKKVNSGKSFEIDIQEFDAIKYQVPQLNKASSSMKVPITVDQMIDKFKTDGWVFSEGEEITCRELLREVNFYTLKHYAKQTHLKSFVATNSVYNFDLFLQNSLQVLTSMIEKFLRTVVVDSLSLSYKQEDAIYDHAQFYLDESFYFSEKGKHRKTAQRRKDIEAIQYSFFKTIEDNKKYPPVAKELNSYGGVSSWVLFDLITFGQLSFFFGKLVTNKKKIVTRALDGMNSSDERITDDLLSSWMNAIRALRNKVSHGMKIYGEPFTVLAKIHDGDKEYLRQVSEWNQNHLGNVLLAMRRIVMCMSLKKQEFWNKKIAEISSQIIDNEYLSATSLGLTEDWIEYFSI
ncbi:Abi family protein [Enterococcus devriesei]|uniref:Abi family protein n=1 Tax=Enterococcus devriesei TaxID=319970 RepID=UPI0036D4268D